ncbi:UNVERIFIED_CONTAM: hypothetical protein FKN15_007798 [Acipenser sinensis]
MYAASHCVEYYINTQWTENMIASSDTDSKTNSSHRLSSFIKMKRISDKVFNKHFENLQRAYGRNKTWLCQIRSVNGGEADLQVFKNEGYEHADEICLRENEAAIQDFQDCFHRFVEFKPWEKLEEDSQLHAEKLREITVRTSDNQNAVFKQDLYTQSRNSKRDGLLKVTRKKVYKREC